MTIETLNTKLQEAAQAHQFHTQQAQQLREQATQHDNAAREMVGRHTTLQELIAEKQAELDAAEAARAETERLAAEAEAAARIAAEQEASRLAAEEALRQADEQDRLDEENEEPREASILGWKERLLDAEPADEQDEAIGD